MKTRSLLSVSLLALAIAPALVPTTGQAAVQYWDVSNANNLTSGSSVWDTGTTAAWANSATPGTASPVVWVNGNDAFFQTAGANTVTLDSAVIANLVTQATNGTQTNISGTGTLTITSGSLTNSGNSAFNLNHSAIVLGTNATIFTGNTITIGASISGLGFGISKRGGSTLTLTGSSTFTGAVETVTLPTALAGTIVLSGSNGSIGSASSVTMSEGTTFRYDNSAADNAARLGATPIGLALNGATFNYLGITSGSNTASAGNVGTLSLGAGLNSLLTTAAASGTGNTSTLTVAAISRGSLATFQTFLASANAATGRVVATSAPATINGIIPWAFEDSNDAFLTSVSGTLGAYGNLAGAYQTGAPATWVATDNLNIVSGTATVNASATTVGSISMKQSGSAATLDLNGQTFVVDSGGILTAGNFNAAIQNGTLTSGSSGNYEMYLWNASTSNSPTISAAIANNGLNPVSVIKGGANNVTLSGSNTYTGATRVTAGTLTIGSGGSLAAGSAVAVADNTGAGALTVNSGGVINGPVTVGRSTGNGVANLVNNGSILGNVTVSGPVSGQTYVFGGNAIAGQATLNAGSTTGPISLAGRLNVSGSLASVGSISGSGTIGVIYNTSTTSNVLDFAGGSSFAMFNFAADNSRATLTQSGTGGVTFQYWGYNTSSPNANYTLSGGTWSLLNIGQNNTGAQVSGTTTVTGGAAVSIGNTGFSHGAWNVISGTMSFNGGIGRTHGSDNTALKLFVNNSGGGESAIVSTGGLTLSGAGDTTRNILTVGDGGRVALAGGGNLTLGDTTVRVSQTNGVFLTGGKIVAPGTLSAAAATTGQTRLFDWTGGQLSVGTITPSAGFNGPGSINSTTLTQTAGTMAPGDIGSPGLTTVSGSYTITGGTVAMNLGGVTASASFQDSPGSGRHDRVTVTGALSLGGTLTADLVGGFNPGAASSFTIMTGAAVSGSFVNPSGRVNLGNDPFDGSLAIVVSSTNVVLNSYVGNEWQGAGNWGTGGTAAWRNAVDPNAAGKGAKFSSFGAANNTLSLDANRTVGAMIFESADYTINAGGGTLTLDSGTTSSATVAVNSNSHVVNAPVTLTSNLAVTGSAGSSLKFGGALTGASRNLSFSGTNGTLILAANNTYNDTTISSGTVQVGDGGTAGTLGSGTVSNNGALAFNRSDSVTFATVVSGTGRLDQKGTGALVLTGNNSYSGPTVISSGTLQVGNGGTAGKLGSGAITNNGVLVFDRSDAIVQGTDFSGSAISGSGSVIKNGSGALTLTGVNTYTGGVTLNSGTLRIDNGAALGQLPGSPTNQLTFAGNSTLEFFGSPAIAANRNMQINGGVAGVFNTGTFTPSLSSAIAGSGTLVKQGSGTLTLSASSAFTGSARVESGVLAVSNANGLGAAGGGGITLAGGTIEVRSDAGGAINNGNITVVADSGINSDRSTVGSPGQTQTLGTLAIGGQTLTVNMASRVNSTSNTQTLSFTGTTTLTGAPTIIVNNASATANGVTFNLPATVNAGNLITLRPSARAIIQQSGIITGTGGILVDSLGGGQLNLNQANTFSGGVTVNSGTLRIGVSSAQTSGTVTSGATGTGALTMGNGTTIDNANGATWNAPRLNTSGTVRIVGGNRLNVALNTWDIGGGTRLNVDSKGLVVTGGTLASDSTGLSTWEVQNTLGALTVQNGLLDLQTTVFGSGTYAAFRLGNNGTFISFSSDAELKVGANVMLLSNGSFTLAGAPRVTIEAGGILNSIGADMNVASLAGGGLYTPSLLSSMTATKLLTINGTSGSATFSGTIQNGPGVGQVLRLTKSGAGTQVLAGGNLYSGTTTVSGGVLSVAAGSGLTNTVDVRVTGGELNVNGSVNASALVTVTGGGKVSGTGSVGNLTISAGSVAAGNSIGTLTTGSLSLAASGTLAIEINTTAVTADKVAATDLTIASGANLTLSDLGGNVLLDPVWNTPTNVFSILTYSGVLTNNLLTYNSNQLTDGEWFAFGANMFEIDYNYNGNEIALLVVPEPSTVALSLLAGAGMLLMRRRRR
jgi:autotransporter-associated beta strand protein